MNNFVIGDIYDSYYGNFRTRTFADIFENLEKFKEYYDDVEIPKVMTEEELATLFYLLYGHYGNSHIASSDENQFIYGVFSTIFMYGGSWAKRVELQKKIRELTSEDILKGSKTIYNHAYNPGTDPSTDTTDPLSYINEQNTTNHERNLLEAYSLQLSLIETDVTESFLYKFKKLFITVVEPDGPLWYITKGEIDD